MSQTFRGIRALGGAVGELLRHYGVFLKLAVPWALVLTAVPIAYCVLVDIHAGRPINIGSGLFELGRLENFRLRYLLTAIPSVLAGLAVAVGWTQYVLLAKKPRGLISLPSGTARYFSLSLLLGFGFILALVPIAFAAKFASIVVPPPWDRYGAITVTAIGAILLVGSFIRMWLAFPAAAIGRSGISFRKSFKLTHGHAISLFAGTVLGYLSLLASVPIGLGTALAERYDASLAITEALSDLLTNILAFTTTALLAGYFAIAYRILVPEVLTPISNEKGDPREPPQSIAQT